MKIKILTDCHHRISSALSQSFSANSVVDVPKKTAEALIERKVAETTTETVTQKKEA
ncbi:hypothetical protein [Pseudophaeobacter sp. C1-32P7]|uniref:hypothetical protein n=1 Tax=Pseudophaeobacter sp. C1-32P7 TaxID=3098142 RepID=UPI0034D7300C